jgi:hypothetical protein
LEDERHRIALLQYYSLYDLVPRSVYVKMAKSRSDPDPQHCYLVYPYIIKEVVVYMERPIEPNGAE